MTDVELIYVEPRQQATLEYEGISVPCRTVPDAWLAWAQLESDQKEHAVIQVGEDIFDISSIRRLRYRREQEADAA